VSGGRQVTLYDPIWQVTPHSSKNTCLMRCITYVVHCLCQMATRNTLCLALKKASSHGQVDVVELLLDAGADVTARDESGDSQAHFAVSESVSHDV